MEASKSSNSEESIKVDLNKLKEHGSKLTTAMGFNMTWLAWEMHVKGILSKSNYEIVSELKTMYGTTDKVQKMVEDFINKVELDPENLIKLVNIMKERPKEYQEAITFLEETKLESKLSEVAKDSEKYKTFDNFTTGENIKLKGVAPNSGRIAVNIFNAHKSDDIIFHFNPRFDERCVVRNSRFGGAWGPEERDGGMVFTPGKEFSLSIIVESEVFRVLVDDKFFCEFKHRSEVPNSVLLEFDCDTKSF